MSRSSQVVEDATSAVRDLAATVADQTPQLIERAQHVAGQAVEHATERFDDVVPVLRDTIIDVAPVLRDTLAPAAATGVVAFAKRRPLVVGAVAVSTLVVVGGAVLASRRARRAQLAAGVGDVPDVPPLVPPVEAPVDPVDHQHDHRIRSHGAA